MAQSPRTTARIISLLAAVLLAAPILAHAQTIELYIGQGEDFLNHYPGPDGLIGNGDDVVSASLTSIQSSAPNSTGSLGHNAFFFGPAGAQDPALPTGYDAITFVNGTVTADLNVLANGGGPVVTALNITSGTEPFPGHGAYTSTISAVNSGTYNPATGDMTLNVDISYTIFGNVSTEPGVVLTGTAIHRTSAEFGTPTGNAYVDSVAVPFAQASGASDMLFLTGSGSLTNLGFPINATLVALDVGGTRINQGMSDAWFDPATAGQGFFVIVWPDTELIFLSWFTYDTERPPMDVTANLGEPGHRWLTAQGPFSGNTANLSVYLTEGGVFDAVSPAPSTGDPIGTIDIIWPDCENADLDYDISSLGLSGSISLVRIVSDNVALCEALNP